MSFAHFLFTTLTRYGSETSTITFAATVPGRFIWKSVMGQQLNAAGITWRRLYVGKITIENVKNVLLTILHVVKDVLVAGEIDEDWVPIP